MTANRLLRHSLLAAGLAAATLAVPGAARADDASPFQFSGFTSIVAGRTFGASLDANYTGATQIKNRDCPCYIADWANAGVYDNRLTLAPESRIGLQGRYNLTRDLYAVAQVVVRGTDNKHALQWAYAGYKLDDNWEIQVGRKRIPLYYYSDFQDIGTAYPWIGVPPELYGWEATNYNGASVRYKTRVAGASVAASAFGGQETVHDSPYYKLLGGNATKVTWKDLAGADLEVTRGPVTARLVYMQANIGAFDAQAGIDDHARLKAYGVAVNVDFDDWFVLSELARQTRGYTRYRFASPEFNVTAGYRHDAWTPTLSYGRYREQSSDLTQYAPADYSRASATLRYDIDAVSAVKVQFDRYLDLTNNYSGSPKVARVAYERSF
jgi:hypothetical protein